MVRNVVQNKLRERRLMLGEEEYIPEISQEESEYEPLDARDLEMANPYSDGARSN